jgi:hypothetical protein
VSEVRLPRRRRSASHTPVLVDPADIPDDAAGRVEVLAVRAPADVLDPGDHVPEPPPVEKPSRLLEAVSLADGWVAVGVLAAGLLVLFIVGMLFTR